MQLLSGSTSSSIGYRPNLRNAYERESRGSKATKLEEWATYCANMSRGTAHVGDFVHVVGDSAMSIPAQARSFAVQEARSSRDSSSGETHSQQLSKQLLEQPGRFAAPSRKIPSMNVAKVEKTTARVAGERHSHRRRHPLGGFPAPRWLRRQQGRSDKPGKTIAYVAQST